MDYAPPGRRETIFEVAFLLKTNHREEEEEEVDIPRATSSTREMGKLRRKVRYSEGMREKLASNARDSLSDCLEKHQHLEQILETL